VLMFEGFPLYFDAFSVCRLLFYCTELFVHSNCMSDLKQHWHSIDYPPLSNAKI
jgi:hypothetical protein